MSRKASEPSTLRKSRVRPTRKVSGTMLMFCAHCSIVPRRPRRPLRLAWGPLLELFVSDEDRERWQQIHDVLAAELPFEVRGYSTHFSAL
jgi:hypothetical protein